MAVSEDQQDLLSARLHHMISIRTPDEDEVIRDRQRTGNNSLHCAVLQNDVDACLRESQNVDINDVNAKGETPLHIAAMNTSQEGANLIDILVAKGGDVNFQNKWGQTPLHYAAVANCVENLQKLTAVPSIDVNIADVNGYNALHCLISSELPGLDSFEDFEEEVEEVSSDLKKAIDILGKAGTEINSQTKYGKGILHLASTRRDNTSLLRHILHNFPEIDLRAKTQMGENFLHVYVVSEILEVISDLFDEISEKNLPLLKGLLNDQNVLGRTPWCDMIDDANVSEEVIRKILSYGVLVNSKDNLGNTALHRIAGVSAGIFYTRITDLLIQGGADINAENVYRETPGFILFLRAVFDVFAKYEMDFN